MPADPLVFHDPLARALSLASIGALTAAETGLHVRTRATRNSPADRGTYWVFAVAIGVAIWVGSRAPDWAPGMSLSDGGWWPVIAGLAVFWAGVGLRWWAILTLGRFFQLTVVVQEDHRVVESGPYRVLRHPGYTGTVLLTTGIGLTLDNALSVAVLVLLPAIAVVRRIAVEEAELRRRLGDAYGAYAARTSRLIPGLW